MPKRTREQTSRIMSRIHGKDTGIEMVLRKTLWRRGHRYRKNVTWLPGKPDIVFRVAKVAIFCDGEFWHGKNWMVRQKDLHGNRAFWVAKIERNRARDRAVNAALRETGWTVLRFWGNTIERKLNKVVDLVEAILAARGKRDG